MLSPSMTGRTVTFAARLALGLALWVLPAAARPSASVRRVSTFEMPVGLERALRTALTPWGMRVERARASAPGAGEQPGTVARALRADALIWLAPGPSGPLLWLYDGDSGVLTARAVPAPPFDETRSAALALSVKTALLESRDPARGADPGGSDGADVAGSATPPAAPAVEPRSGRPELDTALDGRASPESAPHVRLLLHAAARHGATRPVGSVGRYGVEARWAPWASAGAPRTVWLGARLDTGFDTAIERPWFSGAYSELGGGVGAGMSWRLRHQLEAGLQLGASLQSATLSGTIRADGQPSHRSRLGASLQVRPELAVLLGSFGIFVQPSLGATFARQLFLVDAVETLETRPLWWQLGVGVRVDVD
jgi:hypothetical protein